MHISHRLTQLGWTAVRSALLLALTAPSLAAAQGATPVALPDAARVFAVAHNSGRSLVANRRALLHGADIVEIDVRSLDDQLISSHYPVFVAGELNLFLGPTVEQIWDASRDADAIQLDLKESSDDFVQLVIVFLQAHAGERQVIVASEDLTTLERLVGVSPDIVLFLSVHDRATLAGLTTSAPQCLPLSGVSVREELLDAESITRLHATGLLVFAWTVNDPLRADELIRLGIDGITTSDLALLASLGGAQPNERLLFDHPSSACPMSGNG